MLVPLAPEVGDPFAAQEGKIALRAGRHGAPGEVSIFLPVSLAVQNVGAQCRDVEIRGYGRQTFIWNGRHYRATVRAVKSFAHRDVIHMVILDSGRLQLADDFREGHRSIQSGPSRFDNCLSIHGFEPQARRYNQSKAKG